MSGSGRGGAPTFPVGSCVSVEDTYGKGYRSRHSAEAQTVIWVSLPNSLDVPPA
jgi:hypothetical protein